MRDKIEEAIATYKKECGYRPYIGDLEIERLLKEQAEKGRIIGGSVSFNALGYANKKPKDLDVVSEEFNQVTITGNRLDFIPLNIPEGIPYGYTIIEGVKYQNPEISAYHTFNQKYHKNYENNFIGNRSKVYLLELAHNLKINDKMYCIQHLIEAPKTSLEEAMKNFEFRELINHIFHGTY